MVEREDEGLIDYMKMLETKSVRLKEQKRNVRMTRSLSLPLNTKNSLIM